MAMGEHGTGRRLIGACSTLGLIAAGIVIGSVVSPSPIGALPGPSESTVVPVEPTRVLDTRNDIGITGKIGATENRKLTVTGSIPTYVEATGVTTTKVVVPAGATGVLLNVTAVVPSAPGFLSIRPGDATGAPATAGLNFVAGDVVPNAITVALPLTGANAGQIDLYYGGPGGATMHVIGDVVGYLTASGLGDLTGRVVALEAGGGGATGPAGAQGPAGAAGADGDQGIQGEPGVDPSNVVHVAKSGGDFVSLNAALASITATAAEPYLVKIAPGVYTEPAITLKDHVDVEGSGQGVTTLTCACGGAFPGAFVTAGAISTEVRHLSIVNSGDTGAAFSSGFVATSASSESVSLLHVSVTASGADQAYGVYNRLGARTRIQHSTIDATGLTNAGYGVNSEDAASLDIRHSTVTASSPSGATGVRVLSGVVTLRDVEASAVNSTASDVPTGILVSGVEGTLVGVTASASGGSQTRALNNNADGPTPSTLTVSNSTLDGDVLNDGSTLTVSNSMIDGDVDNFNSTLTVSNSTLDGDVENDGSTLTVSNSTLDGAVTTIGMHSTACTDVSNAAGAALDADCAAAPAGVTVRYAKVDADAAAAVLLSGVGVTTVVFLGTGIYGVNFTDSVTGCGWLATYNDNDAGVAASGFGVTVERGNTANSLWVGTFNTTTGDPAPPAADDGFTVQVIC